MANLHVQRKKNTPIIPWLLLAAGIAALVWWFFLRNNTDTRPAVAIQADSSSTRPAGTVIATRSDWDDIDFAAPVLSYTEVTDRNIAVRGNNNYGIYGLGENVLFGEGKFDLRSEAASQLAEIKASIDKHYQGGTIRVYGYTDSKGDSRANKELAGKRAEAVKSWLTQHGVNAENISLNAVGEATPVSTNTTEAGRSQNRRVEIVARGKTAN